MQKGCRPLEDRDFYPAWHNVSALQCPLATNWHLRLCYVNFLFINSLCMLTSYKNNPCSSGSHEEGRVFHPCLCVPGADLLKLTREDVIQICGPADGIRLFNALKGRWVFFNSSYNM